MVATSALVVFGQTQLQMYGLWIRLQRIASPHAGIENSNQMNGDITPLPPVPTGDAGHVRVVDFNSSRATLADHSNFSESSTKSGGWRPGGCIPVLVSPVTACGQRRLPPDIVLLSALRVRFAS